MKSEGRVGFAVAATLAIGTFVAAARGQAAQPPATAPSVADLQAQIQNLQNKVEAMETTRQQQEAERAETIQEVLADADKQSELSGGYDPKVGFVLRSPDGLFSFHPGLLIDFRELTSYRESTPTPLRTAVTAKTGYDIQNGFDVTRVRLTFDGHYGENLTYFVQFQDDQGTTFNLYDAFAGYHFSDSPLTLRFGQFKDPLYHERILSEVNLMAVDRTETESFFGGGQTSRVQGADLIYSQDRLRAQLAFHDGYNTINTKFFDTASASSSPAATAGVVAPNFGTTGRVEYVVIGQPLSGFNPFAEYDGGFTALGDNHDILVVGGGADYTQAGDRYGLFHTVDAQFDSAVGLSLYGAYLGSIRHLDVAGGSAPIAFSAGNYYDSGFVAQAAYLITSRIEPFVRYDYTYLQSGTTSGLAKQDIQEVTAGANYYLYLQHAKFTVDGVWLPDGAPVDNDAFGILQGSGRQEFILRVQFQVAI